MVVELEILHSCWHGSHERHQSGRSEFDKIKEGKPRASRVKAHRHRLILYMSLGLGPPQPSNSTVMYLLSAESPSLQSDVEVYHTGCKELRKVFCPNVLSRNYRSEFSGFDDFDKPPEEGYQPLTHNLKI